MSAVATVRLDVKPVNDVPISAPDTYRIAEDLPLDTGSAGVLDSDIDGDGLAAAVAVGPEHGVWFWLPTARSSSRLTRLVGQGRVRLRRRRRQRCAQSVHVTVHVDPVNDAPTVQPLDRTTSEATGGALAPAVGDLVGRLGDDRVDAA